MALFSVAAVVVGVLALGHLDNERQRIEGTLDPAALASQQLYSALLNQETGVRGYALTGQTAFLAPYTEGYAAEKVAASQLKQLAPQLPAASAAELQATLTQAHDWRTRYAAADDQADPGQREAGGQPGHSRGQGGVRRAPGQVRRLPGRRLEHQDPGAGLARRRLGRAARGPARDRDRLRLRRGGAGPGAAQHRDPPGAPARGRGPAGRRRRFRPRGRPDRAAGDPRPWPPT